MRASFRALAVVVVVSASSLRAQEVTPSPSPSPSPSPAAPEPSSSPAASPAAPRPPFVAGYRDGFTVRSESGDFVLRLAGLVQLDGRFFPSDEQNLLTDQFIVRRARPILQGTVAKYFDFYLNPDFGQGTTVLFDAYLDVHFTDKLRLRAGKMKSPVSLERLQSAQNITFVERAFPSIVAPNRDVGLQVHGELAGGAFAYQAALLNGSTDGGNIDLEINDGKELVGRVFFQPWKTKGSSPLRGLGFGLAGTTGTASGALRGYAAASQVSVFSYGATVTASGDRKRWSPQAYFYAGPVGVLAEYIEAHHDVQKIDTGKPAVPGSFKNSAWHVTASWLVTGEAATYGSVKPKNFFVPSAGKWGAVQLVGRVEGLKIDPATFTSGFADPARSVRKATGWGGGVNWIWNSNLKLMLDYERTSFEGGAAAGGDRPAENAVLSRLQVAF